MGIDVIKIVLKNNAHKISYLYNTNHIEMYPLFSIDHKYNDHNSMHSFLNFIKK